jgi:hypothetical protein
LSTTWNIQGAVFFRNAAQEEKMKAKKMLAVGITVISALIIISACSPSGATPEEQGDVAVTEITDAEIVDEIVQTRLYNQCDSPNPLKVRMQFSESISEAKQSELTLAGKVGGEVNISPVVKAQLEASVQQKFASIYTAENGYQLTFDFEVPAQTHQEFTLIWRETRREGAINYQENGEEKSADFSYRVGLDFVASNTNDVGCLEMPTASAISSPTPIPDPNNAAKSLVEGCISTAVWGVYSSDPGALSNIFSSGDGCYDLSALGIFPDQEGVLRMYDRGQKTHLTHGIYTPVNNDSVIEFKVYVESMYLVYPDFPTYVSFAVAPADDPITARSSARFRLWVDSIKNPVVLFRLANVGDSSGYRLPGQRYIFGQTYAVRLELTGNILRVIINDDDTKEALKIPTESKVFYIGYHLPIAAGVDVSIMDVKVDGVLK